MSRPDTIRPLKRIEFEKLGAEGFFDDERVELLFGQLVAMTREEPAHYESRRRIVRALEHQLDACVSVYVQRGFAASDISEPVPDIVVVPGDDYWHEHPQRAFLVVEVGKHSLANDKTCKRDLYALADVTEYWIVDHVEFVIEVYRDWHDGEWRAKSTYQRGDTISMVAFPDVTIAVTDILPPEE